MGVFAKKSVFVGNKNIMHCYVYGKKKKINFQDRNPLEAF